MNERRGLLATLGATASDRRESAVRLEVVPHRTADSLRSLAVAPQRHVLRTGAHSGFFCCSMILRNPVMYGTPDHTVTISVAYTRM